MNHVKSMSLALQKENRHTNAKAILMFTLEANFLQGWQKKRAENRL